MDSHNVDVNVEQIEMAKEELCGYLDLVQNSPLATLTKIEQLISLFKKLLDDANNLHIIDYEFTCGLGAFELSLKRKKSFLSPKKRRKGRQQNAHYMPQYIASFDEYLTTRRLRAFKQ